jgi:hypothetical protein
LLYGRNDPFSAAPLSSIIEITMKGHCGPKKGLQIMCEIKSMDLPP